MNDVLLSTLKTCKMSHSPEEQVFRTHQGTPYRSYRSAFERAVRKAEIENFTFHDLRHTFASWLAMAGVDLPTLQELMGHKDTKMTLRYTHLSSDHKRRTVAALVGFGEKVPSIFTTGHPGQDMESPQLIDNRELGR